MNLPVGKLHVLKMMNSESEPTIPRVRKLSKYMPLPSIKGIKTPPKPARPKLLREKTYKVLEPVYVRGPSDMIEMAPAERVSRKKAELPHIRERQRPSQVSQKPSERPKSSRMSKTNELSIPRRNKAFNQVNNKNDDLRTINQQIINRGFKFNPSVVRNNGPARTVFWFPV
ncbi:hypothetical protein AAG570_009749 [Ranatra chinensis]|uniref:Uncharacterized protein n=1 Tax=Ranatra chinensis TaxID=642074 RepID=A0ABD0YPY9_9HEMI